MMKIKLLIGAMAIAGLVGSPFAAEAKSYKHTKHHSSSMTSGSSTTTGANMRSGRGSAANPSSEGNVGPGTSNIKGPAPGGR